MPLPRSLARFNLKVTNPVLSARRGPPARLRDPHARRTPFGHDLQRPGEHLPDGYRHVVALTYGRESQWVRNVVAAGGCEVLHPRAPHSPGGSEIVRDPERRLVPAPVRVPLSFLGVEDFMVLRGD